MKNTEIKKEVICPYWIVKTYEDKELLEKLWETEIRGYYIYPCKIGKEGSRMFQMDGTSPIEDFFDEDEGVLYRYELQLFQN